MKARIPWNRVLSLVSVFLFTLPVTMVNAQPSGGMPTGPTYTPPVHDRGGREGPLFRDGVDEQLRGPGTREVPFRERAPAASPSGAEKVGELKDPAPDRPNWPYWAPDAPYWDTVRSKWDMKLIQWDVRVAHGMDVWMRERARNVGPGRSGDPQAGGITVGEYLLARTVERLQTAPRMVLEAAVLNAMDELKRRPSGQPGPLRPFLARQSLPPGGLTDPKDWNSEEGKVANPYIRVAEGKWDILEIAKDIMLARAVALTLADIRDQGSSANADMTSLWDKPILGEEDLPYLEGYSMSLEYFLARVPLPEYIKAWDEANRIEDKKRPGKRLQGLPGFAPRPSGNRAGQPSPWGGGPSPGPQRPPQRQVVAVPGQGGGGGSPIGPNPGQGGTLVGGGGGQQGGGVVGGGYSPWGSSQGGGGGSGGELVGTRGKGGEKGKGTPTSQKDGATGGPKSPGGGDKGNTGGGSSAGGSVPPNPYDSVPDNPYGDDSEDSSGDSSDSGGSGRVRGTVTIGEVEVVPDIVEELDLPPADPEAAGGGGGTGGGSDVNPLTRLLNRLPRHRLTPQQRDLVGRAFGTTTGADDKERPTTGGTSGSVSTNPSESRTNDVGGLNVPRPGGGGEGGSLFEALLRNLGLWEKWQAGGPDPAK